MGLKVWAIVGTDSELKKPIRWTCFAEIARVCKWNKGEAYGTAAIQADY